MSIGTIACGLILTALVAAVPARAEEAMTQTGASAAIGTFTASALVVTDPDWKQKWQTPPETAPAFATTNALATGEKATILVMFSGAAEHGGAANLMCDLTVKNADGSSDSHPPQPCFKGPLGGSAGNVFLSGLQIALEATDDDPPGIVRFDIGVTDVNRGVRLPLTVSVDLHPGTHQI